MLFIHWQHWNSYLISQNTLILALFFYKHWNSYLILPHVRILVLFLETLGSWPYPSKHWNCGPIFLTLEFLPYFNAHWNFDVILRNIETLTLFLQSLQFLTCPSTAITGILTPSFQTLEIQPYLYPSKRLNSGPFLQTLEFWSNSFTLWNSGPVFYRLEFSAHSSEHLNSGPVLTNTGILILSFHWKH